MNSLAWKLNRLRLMGGGELVWRVQQLLQKKAAARGWGLVRRPPAPTATAPALDFVRVPVDAAEVAALCAAAERLLAGRWAVFAMQDAALGFPPEWNRDPKTGTRAPMALGKAIDYRREALVGDIKYLWEPSRHLELVTLALAWRASGELRFRNGAVALLESWLDQCPYPHGVHWTSSLELAVRLLNWAFAWQLLGGEDSPLFAGEAGQTLRRRWLDAIYQHCHFISGFFSRHSSANNHLFGEYMGLFVAGVVWPCWPQSTAWRERAQRGLETEALAQNFEDGVNREQAIYYHHEVMDMMLLCQRVGAAAGVGFSPAYLGRLERMADFVHALMDAGGHVPMTGDADDALMLRLAYGPGHDIYRSLLASCALLFGRADLRRKAGGLDAKTRLLFGAQAEAGWAVLDEAAGPEGPVMAFPNGGYYLLGNAFGTAAEVRALLDCGPLGYLSIAAHGHADALALCLSIGGHEFLIDPGTYSYHTQKRWRDHFRSTAAHNTVEVDGYDQSVIGGNFMWLHKAQARLLAHQPLGDVQRFAGQHDGYARLPDPVLHRRELEFDRRLGVIEVVDTLECEGAHAVALNWHFAEACQVAADGQGLRARSGTAGLEMSCEAPGFVLTLSNGDEVQPAGWISRRFDEKQPTTTARWSGRIKGTTVLRTRISLQVPAGI